MSFEENEIKKCSKFANLEDFEKGQLGDIRRRFEENHTILPIDFFTIIYWKSNRSITGIRRTMARIDIQTLFRKIYGENNKQKKVEILLEIKGKLKNREKGIGIPIASSILAALYPSDFSIFDERIWNTLRNSEYDTLFLHKPATSSDYVKFNENCGKIANENKISRRGLDNYLWGKDLHNNLKLHAENRY